MKAFLFIALLAVAGIHVHAQSTDAPLVQFGNFNGYGVRDVTVEQVLEKTRIKCLAKKCRIVSFDIYGIVPNKEYIGPYRSEGDTMSNAQKRYIRSLVPGGKLWINNIVLRYNNGTEKVIGSAGTEYSIYFFNIK